MALQADREVVGRKGRSIGSQAEHERRCRGVEVQGPARPVPASMAYSAYYEGTVLGRRAVKLRDAGTIVIRRLCITTVLENIRRVGQQPMAGRCA